MPNYLNFYYTIHRMQLSTKKIPKQEKKKLCEDMKQISDSIMTDYRSIRQGIQNNYN